MDWILAGIGIAIGFMFGPAIITFLIGIFLAIIAGIISLLERKN